MCKPLYAHAKHQNAAAPLETKGSFGNLLNKLGFVVSLEKGVDVCLQNRKIEFCQYFFETEVGVFRGQIQ